MTMIKKLSFLALAIASLPCLAQTSFQDLDPNSRWSKKEIQGKAIELQQQLFALRDSVQVGLDQQGTAIQQLANRPDVSASVLDLENRLSQLENNIRNLQGSLEELTITLNTVASNQATQRSGFQSNSYTQQSYPASSTIAPTAPITAMASGQNAADEFNTANRYFESNDYASSESAFQNFLNSHSNSPLAQDAYFMLGQSQYQQGKHASAAKNFMSGYKQDKAGSRAPDNLLSLGDALSMLGKKTESCTALREFEKLFPNASVDLQSRLNSQMASLSCQS